VAARRIAVVLALALVACGRSESWTTVTAGDGTFRVEMPGGAEHARKALGTPVGQAPIEMWVQQDGQRAFVAGFTEYPDAVREHFDPERLLDSARDGAVERVRGKLLRDDPHELAGVKGRRIEIAAEGGSVRVRGDFYVQGRRLYQVLATTAPKDAESPDIERFLGSFVLLPKTGVETELDARGGKLEARPAPEPPTS
jgi:hypothetical protein